MAETNLIGKNILSYTIREKLGSGAFGTVYKVIKDDAVGQSVRALKHITIPTEKQYNSVLNSMGGDASKADNYFSKMLENIVSEIRILKDLSEQNIQHIVRYYEHDIVVTDSPRRYDIFILMEYLTPLEDIIRSADFFVRDVVRLGLDILSGLQSCHNNGIIHRDIKDDNIFVTNTKEYKIGDFGVSKVLKDSSKAESLKGTPNFIAPEVYLGKESYTKSVDLYSLGIVLYRLLNYNRNPFLPHFPEEFSIQDEDTAFNKRMKGNTPGVPSLGGEEIGQVIVKAISNSSERFQTADEFINALKWAAENTSADVLNEKISNPPPKEYDPTLGEDASFNSSEDEEGDTSINKDLFNTITPPPKSDPEPPVPPPPPPKPHTVKLIAVCAVMVILLVAPFAWWNFSKPYETVEQGNNEEPTQESNETDGTENTEPPVQGTWWSVEDNVLTIHGTGPMDDYPENYRPWAEQRFDITKIVIEEGVESVGKYAFYKLHNVTDIQIPTSVTSIGDNAFYECRKLSEVIIPDSVKIIGDSVFSGCEALQYITLPNSVESIGLHAFSRSGLVNIAISDNVTDISSGMFMYCNALSSVVISDGVSSIGEYAFDGCTSLTDITIPSSIKSIGKFAFYGCNSLTKVYIPNHDASIDPSAFDRATIIEGVPVLVTYDDYIDIGEYELELSPEQEALINNLPVDDLPKDAVETLGPVQLDQIWRDTLMPLASDPSHDITLYGVVNAEWLAEVQQQGKEEPWDTWDMPEPLIILRHGSEVISQVCSWFSNAKYSENPWIAVDDFDNDGKDEIAICTFDESGTGAAHHSLLIYDLESQQFFSPDASNLDILVDSAWEENRITLHGGVYTLEVPVDDFVAGTDDMHTITYGLIVDYTYNEYGAKNQRIQCETKLSFGYEGWYFADVTVPIVFSDGHYKLGDVANIRMAY